MALHDFARMFDVGPGSRDVVTVSGYVFQLLGKVPEKGASVPIGHWLGSIEAVDRRKVKTLRLTRMPAQEPEPARPAGPSRKRKKG
jgi:CBS domain containing-hemolysin-like protein